MVQQVMDLTSEYYIELGRTIQRAQLSPARRGVQRREGVWVYDVDGKRYLDCLSAYSAVNQGHCHPAHRAGARSSRPAR